MKPRIDENGNEMVVLGAYRIAQSGAAIRDHVDITRQGDYGSDPVGDGTFRMVPSGDIVDFEERNRRLKR